MDNNKIFILVFGDIAGRRFTQTFILASQGIKKYYILTEIFMYCDVVFLPAADHTNPSVPVVPSKPTIPNVSITFLLQLVCLFQSYSANVEVNGDEQSLIRNNETKLMATSEEPKNTPIDSRTST